jgi:hypothetical protein
MTIHGACELRERNVAMEWVGSSSSSRRRPSGRCRATDPSEG